MALENKVFFESIDPFILINDDGLIKTDAFLNASKYIVQFVDLLGTTFKPVKNDIHGNIVKLTKIFESDSAKYEHLNDIVKIEKETLQESEFHIGSDALMWLNRALIYNQIFLSNFINEYKASSHEAIETLSDDISRHFTLAYELSLKKHHNWFVQKIFTVCLMAAPNRGSLLTYLGYLNQPRSANELKDLIVQSIENYLTLLKSNTEAISILLLSHGFQP